MPLIKTYNPFRVVQMMFPFGEASASYRFNARNAIFHGCRALRLDEKDSILVPAYCCGSEIDALQKAGLETIYYRVTKHLRPDLEHIQQLLNQHSPKALFVTHYFGFPQPIAKLVAFAKQNHLLVIEDNAHGLYSCDAGKRPLGSFGDIGIFSFVKSLPIPEGGCYVINNPTFKKIETEDHVYKNKSCFPRLFAIAGKLKFQVELAAQNSFPKTTAVIKQIILDPLILFLKQKIVQQYNVIQDSHLKPNEMSIVELKLETISWKMSLVSKMMARCWNPVDIVRHRRQNFLFLLENFPASKFCCPLLDSLPDGCCPLFFPIKVVDAEMLQKYLAVNSVYTKKFWSIFHENFPTDGFQFERSLKQNTIVLPIHQDLDESHMKTILQHVRNWSPQK